MRILSPFKDFYDFVVVEPDNKKMYIRETKDVVYSEEEYKKAPERTILSPVSYEKINNMRNYGYHPFDKGYVGMLLFCDRVRSFLVYDNLIYWHYEDVPEEIVKKIQKSVKTRWYSFDDDTYEKYNWNRDPLKDILRYKKIDWIIDRHTKQPLKTTLNKLFNTPVVKYCGIRNITLNPKLNELGFNKAITPTEAYQDVYNWIPYNEPEVPKSPDDMNRYEAKGFDKKTSFRPNMK